MKCRFIYGPVDSWRLGKSLGIDLLSPERKVCNFDCIYCQAGKTSKYSKTPKIYIKAPLIISELKKNPRSKIDYITFSGRGEPTLAENLGQTIRQVKKLRLARIAVLTNAALLCKASVRKNLSYADIVCVKLDAYSQASLEKINRPGQGIKFSKILEGIKRLRREFKGKFALQIMFVRENKPAAARLAQLAREIKPDEVQINTPLRPCKASPLSKQDIEKIKKYFSGMRFICVK